MTPKQIAVQLYTVRDLCQTPSQTAKTLERLRAIGYAAVEVAGICPLETDELLRMTREEGMTICAYHDAPDAILNDTQRVADRVSALGCGLVVYSYPVGFDLSKTEEVSRLIGKLSDAGRVLQAAGRTLCYHHHSLEFVRQGGMTVLDRILAEVEPEALKVELDTYWIQHGGGDPAQWCARLKNRLPILHLKDYGSVAGVPTMMEVGQGNLDWPRILAAAETSGCRWFAVEQDVCPGDPLESLSISYNYIRSNLAEEARA